MAKIYLRVEKLHESFDKFIVEFFNQEVSDRLNYEPQAVQSGELEAVVRAGLDDFVDKLHAFLKLVSLPRGVLGYLSVTEQDGKLDAPVIGFHLLEEDLGRAFFDDVRVVGLAHHIKYL